MSILPPLEKYRVREVDFGGHTWPIVLHARGGSSLLVALANAVLRALDFRKALKTEGGVRGRPKYVCTEVLFQIIEMAIVDRLQLLLKSTLIDVDTMVSAWKGCRVIIRLLHSDYGVDPIFTSCKAFAESDLDMLFSFLGFQVYHGSVIDPEDRDTANAIGSKSFSEILEILKSPPAEVEENTALMKKFVDNTKVRLTSYGLTCLKESIGHVEVGILFRYDRFSMLCKINGVLVTLQATEEQFKKNPDAVWQSLEEVNDDGMLLSSNNVHVKKQAVITDAEEAIAMKRQEAIIQAEAQEKLKLSKPSSKQRKRAAKRAADKSQFEVQPEFVELEEVAACDKKSEQELKGSNNPSEGEPDRLEQQEQEVEPEETGEERDDDMSKSLMCFLRKFKEKDADKPFYEGQVKALDYCNPFKLTIKFKDLESYDRETARYICNNMPRVSERLTYCVSKFLLEYEEFKRKPEEVFRNTKIEISDLPSPNSVQAFSKFAMENDMHKLWILFDCGEKIVSATTYLGRKAAVGYLKFILKKHKARKCFNGSFQLEDLVVLVHGDGSLQFVIRTEASEDFDIEKAVADFNRFCVLVFPYFMDEKADEMPAYFDLFQLDYLKHMPNCDNTEEYENWQKYMANHFAFKAPQACTTLVTETYEICASERTGQYILDCAGDLLVWTSFIQSSGSLSLMETYEYGATLLTNCYDELSYWKLLMYGRHYSRHMLLAKRKEGITIKVQDLLIIHLMLGHVLKGEMAKVIRYIMVKVNGFAGGLFSSAWRHFEASETFDDDVNNMLLGEDVKEICLDTADVAKVSPGEDSKAPPVDKCDGATTSSEPNHTVSPHLCAPTMVADGSGSNGGHKSLGTEG